MSNPVQINNEEQDTVEIPIGEYEAIVSFSTKIAQQNALVLKAIETLSAEVRAAAETNTANMGAFLDSFHALLGQITPVVNVSVPEQPAPVINIPAPIVNIAPAEVTLKTPPEKKKKVSMTMKRTNTGYQMEGTEE